MGEGSREQKEVPRMGEGNRGIILSGWQAQVDDHQKTYFVTGLIAREMGRMCSRRANAVAHSLELVKIWSTKGREIMVA